MANIEREELKMTNEDGKQFLIGLAFVIFVLICIIWYFQGQAYANAIDSKHAQTTQR